MFRLSSAVLGNARDAEASWNNAYKNSQRLLHKSNEPNTTQENGSYKPSSMHCLKD